jgi:hypothetical protein
MLVFAVAATSAIATTTSATTGEAVTPAARFQARHAITRICAVKLLVYVPILSEITPLIA